MSISHGLLVIGVACLATCVSLVLVVISRKARRDRREQRMQAQRHAIAEAIGGDDTSDLARICRSASRGSEAQVDLATALEHGKPKRI